jgi:hypothetical protein
MASRKVTNGNATDWTLTPQQQTAVDLLASGRNIQETADQVQVARETVSGWLHHHCGFQAALNRRRQELWQDLVEGLRGLLPQALAVLARELEGETPLPAAIHVLRCCGLYGGIAAPSGPTTVEDAEQAQRRRELERTRTRLTDEDVALADQSRQADRTLAALSGLALA